MPDPHPSQTSTDRRSYRRLMMQPSYLLYDEGKLVASIRANNADEARRLFKKAGLTGTHMRTGDTT